MLSMSDCRTVTSESENAEKSVSGFDKYRLMDLWLSSNVIGDSGGVTSTQFSSFIRASIDVTSTICKQCERYVKSNILKAAKEKYEHLSIYLKIQVLNVLFKVKTKENIKYVDLAEGIQKIVN